MAVLTFEQRLKAAVWMVGNMDTDEDKAAWWRDYGDLFKEVSGDPDVQRYADEMAHRSADREDLEIFAVKD